MIATTPVLRADERTGLPSIVAEAAALIAADTPRTSADAPDTGITPTPAAAPQPAPALAVGCASKIGSRQQNDDYAAYSASHDFYAIADGIGGAPHGDVASACAVNAAVQSYEATADFHEAFLAANRAVIQVCTWMNSPSTGTTLLVAEHADGQLNFAWAGDTAAFLVRDHAFATLTEPDRHQGGNALKSAVGYNADLAPRTAAYALEPGDRVLLCTDGVWEVLPPARLVKLLESTDNAPWIAETIAREAADAGFDNATALVLIAASATGASDPAAGESPEPAPAVPTPPLTPLYPHTSYRESSESASGHLSEHVPERTPDNTQEV